MEEAIRAQMAAVEKDSETLTTIMNEVVQSYSEDLDKIMAEIQNEVLSIKYPSIMTVERLFLALSSCLYFMCEKVEQLGVFDSLSKSKAQEVYNLKYLEHQHSNEGVVGAKKPTVAESQAVAETAALYERVLNDLYNKSYKVIKNKIDAAEMMVSTLSKILSHRMQESQMTQAQTSRQILNEQTIKTEPF